MGSKKKQQRLPGGRKAVGGDGSMACEFVFVGFWCWSMTNVSNSKQQRRQGICKYTQLIRLSLKDYEVDERCDTVNCPNTTVPSPKYHVSLKKYGLTKGQ